MKICISFDWHNDRSYRNMLSAWLANPKNPIDFQDLAPGAIDTSDVGRVKAVLTTQIRAATHTLVLVGAYANTTHRDSAKMALQEGTCDNTQQALSLFSSKDYRLSMPSVGLK